MTINLDKHLVDCFVLQLQCAHSECVIRIKSVQVLDRENGWVVIYDREPVGRRAEGLDSEMIMRLAYFRPDWRTMDVRCANDIIVEA